MNVRRTPKYSLTAFCFVCCLWGAAAALATPLDDYVAKPDPAFEYSLALKTESDAYTTLAYHLVSQTWLDASKVDRPKWEHWVVVTVPKEVEFPDKAFMFIGGGSTPNGNDKPPTDNGPLSMVAVMTKTIVAEIRQIPNQPLHFTDEQSPKYKERGRGEDELIAYGWDKFMKDGDALWLPRLPMTKAVVRAMDLVQKENPKVDGFFVAGGSKRGWTTWTTAAVDKRVVGIAPAVIDVLNIVPSLDNHHAAYGFWAPAVGDYVEMDIVSRIHTPQFAELAKVVEPYSYRDRLTMPKYIVNSSGDQFFPPDSWKFYFNDLKGEKYLCYIPNTDHGLNAEAYANLASFYYALFSDTPRPKFTWEKAKDGSLKVQCETKPQAVLLWQAHNPKARDFRLESVGKIYTSTPLPESAPGVYEARVQPDDSGWTAFFIELTFENPGFPKPFKFTTGISILPDAYPK